MNTAPSEGGGRVRLAARPPAPPLRLVGGEVASPRAAPGSWLACGAWATLRGSRRPSCWSVRDSWASSATASATSAATRQGWVVLVRGEAGIGKTALLRALLPARCPGSVRVLWAACDPLFTPRPLGPLLDIARAIGGELHERAGSRRQAPRRRRRPHGRAGGPGADRPRPRGPALGRRGDARRRAARQPAGAGAAGAARRHLSRRAGPPRPSAADGARRAGRRADRCAASSCAASRATAVAALARGSTVDPDLLHDRTGGNPFFVTEALAADTDGVPATVRDAVLARAARLSAPARATLDAVADRAAAGGGLAAGGTGGRRARRPRGVPELGHAPRRRGRNRVSPRAGAARDRGVAAPRPGRRAAPPRPRSPGAAPRSARPTWRGSPITPRPRPTRPPSCATRRRPPSTPAVGSPREAQDQYGRALRFAQGLPPELRADLLERFGDAGYLTDMREEAVQALTDALRHPPRPGRSPAPGRIALRLSSRLLTCMGRTAEAKAAAVEAIGLARAARARAPSSPAPTARCRTSACSPTRRRTRSCGAHGRSRSPSGSATPRPSSTRSTTSAPTSCAGASPGAAQAGAQPGARPAGRPGAGRRPRLHQPRRGAGHATGSGRRPIATSTLGSRTAVSTGSRRG